MRTASRVRTVTGPFPVLLLMLNLLATSALCGELRVAGNPIRVGILHSLSGTMGISEAPLKDTLLMLIEQQNEAGGLLGRKLEAIVVDPASNWPLFTEGARELLELDQVDVVFGCWTSVSRKAVLPVFEELNGLLFYPLQYEGQEASRNVFYTGATPNQQAIPATEYMRDELGIERWVLLGTDYVYPHTTNRILRAYLKSKGVQDEDIQVIYTPFGYSDWEAYVKQIKRFGSQGRRTAIISTINGDANVPFYRELAYQQVAADAIPVIAFSVGEQELATLGEQLPVGHLAAWNYFMSVQSAANSDFIRDWRAFTGDNRSVTNDPMEAHYIGFKLWAKAVQKAGTTDPDRVRDAIVGLEVPNLSGGMARMLPNHHITKPAMVGQIRDDGQFNVIWRSAGAIPGDPWSDYLPESENIITDWRPPIACGHYDTKTRTCSPAP